MPSDGLHGSTHLVRCASCSWLALRALEIVLRAAPCGVETPPQSSTGQTVNKPAVDFRESVLSPVQEMRGDV